MKEALEEIGLNLDVIEDQEPDPALGNGGLGRLAKMLYGITGNTRIRTYGRGIRYRYGMFKQQISDGFQGEVPDNWLKNGYPFELRRPSIPTRSNSAAMSVPKTWEMATPDLSMKAISPLWRSHTICRS